VVAPGDAVDDGKGGTLKSREFVQQLVDEMEELFAKLGDRETLESESEGQVEVMSLLRVAMRSEIEASEVAGHWMPITPEIDIKTAFAQQCGDEMRHYNLIAQRLAELGADLSDHDPTREAFSPYYHYLRSLSTSLERVAAGPFTMEAVAEVRNLQFIELCQSLGDDDTARLYIDIIQPEEVHHKELGRKLLEKYAVTESDQELVSTAMRNSLAIADELRTLTERTTGLRPILVS